VRGERKGGGRSTRDSKKRNTGRAGGGGKIAHQIPDTPEEGKTACGCEEVKCVKSYPEGWENTLCPSR